MLSSIQPFTLLSLAQAGPPQVGVAWCLPFVLMLAAIAVTPRLVSQITPERHELPLGKDVWGDTSIGLPGHPRARLYRNVFTGETFAPNAGDFPRLSLGDILGILPVAFLEAVT